VLPGLADEVVATLAAMPGTLAASVHESHAYADGACLYFTFAGQQPGAGEEPEALRGATVTTDADMAWEEAYYRRAWDAVTEAAQQHGAAISHHHGIGLNRSRFLAGSLGAGFGVLEAVKQALDPAGILNPGKLGLHSAYGEPPWP
jgi:alkyldihydroxyacetonephosphate synthase